MKKYILIGVMAGMACSLAQAGADPDMTVDDGSTLVLNKEGWSRVNVYVGTSVDGNHLELKSGSMTCENAVIGDDSSGNSLRVGGSNTVWNSTQRIYAGGYGSDNALRVEDGASVTADYGLVGYGTSSSSNSITVTGAGSTWTSRWLDVGFDGSGNELAVLDGGSAAVEWLAIGLNAGASGNVVRVSGLGSMLTCSNQLDVGYNGSGNLLLVEQGGVLEVGSRLNVLSGNTLDIGSSGSVHAGSYYQSSDAFLQFGISTNTQGAPVAGRLEVDGSAAFEAGAVLLCYSEIGALEFGSAVTNCLVSAGTLEVDGVVNPTDLSALTLGNSLLDAEWVAADNSLFAILGRKQLADAAGMDIDDGSSAYRVVQQIDLISGSGGSAFDGMLETLDKSGMDAAELAAALLQEFDYRPSARLHGQIISSAFGSVRNRQVSGVDGAAPAGTAGPSEDAYNMRGWISGFGAWAERSAESGFSAYDQDVWGTLIGCDRLAGAARVGVAGGYAASNVDQDSGGTSEADTALALLYAEIDQPVWSADFNLGYGISEVSSRAGSLTGSSAEYHVHQLGFYAGGRRRIGEGRRIVLVPGAAVSGGYYNQASHTDRGAGRPDILVENYETWSGQSELSCALESPLVFRRSVVTPRVLVGWVHEFNADSDRMDYSIAGVDGSYTFLLQAPVEDLFRLGTSLDARLGERIEIELGLTGYVGEHYESIAANARLGILF